MAGRDGPVGLGAKPGIVNWWGKCGLWPVGLTVGLLLLPLLLLPPLLAGWLFMAGKRCGVKPAVVTIWKMGIF